MMIEEASHVSQCTISCEENKVNYNSLVHVSILGHYFTHIQNVYTIFRDKRPRTFSQYIHLNHLLTF